MARYPITLNLPHELIERLRKEKKNRKPSHLVESLLIEHYSLEKSNWHPFQLDASLKEELAQLGQFPPVGDKFWVDRLFKAVHIIKSKQKQIDELKQKESKA